MSRRAQQSSAAGQKQRTAEVQLVQEKTAVQNVFRLTLNEIMFIRGIFPEEAFDGKKFKSGEGRKQLVHQLKDDAKLKDENDLDADQQDDVAAVRSWISEGVFDAINNQYLRCLCFCVHAREDSASLSASSSSSRELSNDSKLTLFECYQYNFRYPDGQVEAGVSVENRAHNIVKTLPPTMVSKAGIADQLALMFRTVCTMCSNLPPTPRQRELSMRLFYYDDVTPPDYDPPCFKDSSGEAVLPCDTEMETVKLGKLFTRHHGIALRLHTPKLMAGNETDPDSCAHVHQDHVELSGTDTPTRKRAVTRHKRTKNTVRPLDDDSDSEEARQALTAAEHAVDAQILVSATEEQEADGAHMEETASTKRFDTDGAVARLAGISISDDGQDTQPLACTSTISDATEAPLHDDDVVRQLREYVKQSNRPVLKDIEARFPDFSIASIRKAFSRLVTEGIVQKLRNGTYRMTNLHISDSSYDAELRSFNTAIVMLFDKYGSALDGITNRTLERECNLPAAVAKTMLKRFEAIGLVSSPQNIGGKKGSRRFVLKTDKSLERYQQARAAVHNSSYEGSSGSKSVEQDTECRHLSSASACDSVPLSQESPPWALRGKKRKSSSVSRPLTQGSTRSLRRRRVE